MPAATACTPGVEVRGRGASSSGGWRGKAPRPRTARTWRQLVKMWGLFPRQDPPAGAPKPRCPACSSPPGGRRPSRGPNGSSAKLGGDAAIRRVRGEVLLDLLDRRAAAEALEVADELHIGEVAGRQRVGLAAAEEAEALERPRPDLGNPHQPCLALAGREVCAPGGDLARALDERQRAARREVERRKLGRGTARPRSRRPGTSRSGPGPVHAAPPGVRGGLEHRPQRRTIRRWICAARLAWISCSVIAQASASHGSGRRRGRYQGRLRTAGPTSGSSLNAS